MPEQLQEQWRDILLELLLSIGHELSLDKQFKQFLPVLLRKLACKAVAVFEIDPIFYQDYVLVKELPRNSGLAQYTETLIQCAPVNGEEIAALDSGKVYAYPLTGYGVLLLKHNDLPSIFQYELRQLCEHFSYRLRACLQHQKLQQSQQELDRFFELSDNLMCIINAAGHFIKVNPAFLEKLNFTLDDFYTMPFTAFIHPDDLTSTEQALHQLFTEQSLTFKNRFRRSCGEYIDLAWDLACDAATGNIYATAMDISQQVAIEEKLLLAKEAAEQTAAAKAAFLANMSHEIRTPLNGVIGMLDIVVQQPLAAEIKQQIQTAMDSGKNLLAIVNDVLDFSKMSAGKLNLELIDFNLNQLMQEVLDAFRYLANQKQLDLIFESNATEASWLKGDPLRIKQVITNLVGNALKFTQQGGVTLKVVLQPKDDANLLCVQVQDTGIGLDTEQQTRLFQAFTQADISTTRHFGGTGLGLTICQELVSLMAGEIRVESEPGHGSTFEVRLSLPTGVPKQATQTVLFSAQRHNLTHIKILLVEDNEVNRHITKAYLAQWGCHIVVAENGAEAIAQLKSAQNKEVDLILMDCLMPIMDGYEAAKRIRHGEAGVNWQQIPILALTANAMSEDRQRCLAAGMDDYLAKPFNQADLSAAIGRLLERAANATDNKAAVDKSTKTAVVKRARQKPEVPLKEATSEPAEVWDKEACYKHFAGMTDLAEELLVLFSEQLPLTLTQLEQAWLVKDYANLRLLSHSLKSSALQLGLIPLGVAAKQLELMLREEQFTNLPQCYSLLVEAVAQSQSFFKKQLHSLNKPESSTKTNL